MGSLCSDRTRAVLSLDSKIQLQSESKEVDGLVLEGRQERERATTTARCKSPASRLVVCAEVSESGDSVRFKTVMTFSDVHVKFIVEFVT